MTARTSPHSEPHPGRILFAAVCGASLGFIGASVVNVALPTFQTELGADATDIQWIVSGYNLAIASLLLSAGAFSDRIGHRATFRFGLVLYTVASIACGAASDPAILIAARVVQGLAAALLVPSSLGLVNTAYAPENRGHAVGLWSSFSAVGAGMGPFIGGATIEFLSWRYMFWMNIPVAAAAWWLLSSANVAPVARHAVERFDWKGAAYSVATLGLFTTAAIESSTFGITHPLVVSLFSLAVIAGWLFTRSQSRVRSPLIPPGMFRSRNFAVVNLVTFLAYCTIGGGFYVMMLTWIQIQGYSPLAAGTITLPFMLFTGGFAHAVGHLVRRTGPKLPLSAGLLCLGCGFLSWTVPGIGTSFWFGYFPGVLVTALGIALLVGPITTVVMGSVEVRYSGTASGVNSAVARSAILLSVAVLGAIQFVAFERAATDGLAALPLGDDTATFMRNELVNMAAAEIPAALSDDTRSAIRSVIDNAFLSAAKIVIMMSGLLALVAAAITWRWVERVPLRTDEGSHSP